MRRQSWGIGAACAFGSLRFIVGDLRRFRIFQDDFRATYAAMGTPARRPWQWGDFPSWIYFFGKRTFAR
jgi:hypothetical protein